MQKSSMAPRERNNPYRISKDKSMPVVGIFINFQINFMTCVLFPTNPQSVFPVLIL